MKQLYLFLAIIGEVVATSSLKDAHGFTKIVPLVVVMVGYSITFFFLSLTFKEMSIGQMLDSLFSSYSNATNIPSIEPSNSGHGDRSDYFLRKQGCDLWILSY